MSTSARRLHHLHTWGECPKRLPTTATYPLSPMPHNCLARTAHTEDCQCAWCGEPAPKD